jgi:enoyl-CoA hydratase / 3-hydroxyacyl-CoA dehydrogenase
MQIKAPEFTPVSLPAQPLALWEKARSSSLNVHSPLQDMLVKAPAIRFGKLAPRTYVIENREGPTSKMLDRGLLVAGGGGLMGSGIGANFLLSQGKVGVMEYKPEQATAALEKLQSNIKVAIAKGVIKGRDVEAVKRKLESAYALPTERLETLKAADFGHPAPAVFLEAIFEKADVKKNLLGHISKVLPDTILTTNTSSIDPKELATVVVNPQRFAVAHYFKLADRNKLLELGRIDGPTPETSTSDETIEKLTKMAWALGKVPVLCEKAAPGFIANRLLVGTSLEALRIYDEGWGTPEEIDGVAKKLLWPLGVGIKSFEKDMMPPFKMFKEYSQKDDLGFTIASNLSKLPDDFYQLPRLLKMEKERVTAARARGEKTNFFDEGLPSPASHPPHQDLPTGYRFNKIQERLLGAMFIASQQIVAEGLAKPEDVDRSAQVGFLWGKGPYGKMQELGLAKTNEIIEVTKADHQRHYGHNIKVNPLKAADLVPNWVDTKVRGDGVMFLTLNRPGVVAGIPQGANALNEPMLKEIRSQVEKANSGDLGKVKAIVIQSNGYKEFCAGAELNEIKARSGDLGKLREFIDLGRSTMDTISGSQIPVVAKVSGLAVGGGMELVLACHRVIMDKDAKMGLPEVNLGLFPAWGGTERLAHKAGKPFALSFIQRGKAQLGLLGSFGPIGQIIVNKIKRLDMDTKGGPIMDAKTAYELGIADYVSSRKNLTDTLEDILSLRPEFLNTRPDAQRGLDMKVSDYPGALRKKFHLAPSGTLGSFWQKWVKTGRYSQVGYDLVGKLVAAAGTPQEGVVSDAELTKLRAGGLQKIAKVEQLIQIGLGAARQNSTLKSIPYAIWALSKPWGNS